MVAALFVEPKGHYSSISGVDLWHRERDARGYAGPHPVVAHPPCHLWVNFAALNFKRYGGEHNRPRNDQGCFSSALAAVRRYGGVLEHPAFSNAWHVFELPRPVGAGWQRTLSGEWVCEVCQAAYGHRARKRTWLLYVSPAGKAPLGARWAQPAGTAQVGWFDRIKPTLSKREALLSPVEFAEFLVALATHAGGV